VRGGLVDVLAGRKGRTGGYKANNFSLPKQRQMRGAVVGCRHEDMRTPALEHVLQYVHWSRAAFSIVPRRTALHHPKAQ
jgi:hypothetical protein